MTAPTPPRLSVAAAPGGAGFSPDCIHHTAPTLGLLHCSTTDTVELSMRPAPGHQSHLSYTSHCWVLFRQPGRFVTPALGITWLDVKVLWVYPQVVGTDGRPGLNILAGSKIKLLSPFHRQIHGACSGGHASAQNTRRLCHSAGMHSCTYTLDIRQALSVPKFCAIRCSRVLAHRSTNASTTSTVQDRIHFQSGRWDTVGHTASDAICIAALDGTEPINRTLEMAVVHW